MREPVAFNVEKQQKEIVRALKRLLGSVYRLSRERVKQEKKKQKKNKQHKRGREADRRGPIIQFEVF